MNKRSAMVALQQLLKKRALKSNKAWAVTSHKAVSSWVQSPVLVLLVAWISGCATPPGVVESWPISSAYEQEFTGEVVDLLCEHNRNCVENCGEGSRQLALKIDRAGVVLVAKNLTNYSGAADELWPYCGQNLQVSGLFTEHRGVRFFQVQNLRLPGSPWVKATRYSEAWAERSGKPISLANDWESHDDRVKAVIERNGVLGLGLSADREYFK